MKPIIPEYLVCPVCKGTLLNFALDGKETGSIVL